MMRRLLTLGVLGLIALSQASVAYYRSYGPRSMTRLSRPTVTWEVWPSEGGKVTSTEMRLNGKKVRATYNAGKRELNFTPDEALSPGDYSVAAKVTVDDLVTVSRAWSFKVSADSLFHLDPPTQTQQRLAGQVNEYRAVLGLGPVTLDDRLDAAAEAHTTYMQRNRTTGHFEQPNDPGFTGNSPSDRMECFGYFGSSYEDVCTGTPSMEVAVRLLFEAPYHRIPFMTPGPVLMGGAYQGGGLTLQFGFGEEAKVVVSPAPGEKNVALNWNQHEHPDPLRMHGTHGDIGYPIIFAAFGENDALKVSSVTVRDGGGRGVPILLNTPENDDHLRDEAIIMPREALRPDAIYRVEVHASVSGRDVSKSWSFRTRG